LSTPLSSLIVTSDGAVISVLVSVPRGKTASFRGRETVKPIKDRGRADQHRRHFG